MSNLDQILAKFENVTELNSGEYSARCPSHDDQKNSLTIRQVTDEAGRPKILVYCHANCTVNSILDKVGLKMADLFTETHTNGTSKRKNRAILATYDYTDESGKLLYQAVRFEPKDFRQRQPDGNGGWTWSVTRPPVRKVLYRLADLTGLAAGTVVFFCEGEKDVDNLASRGYVATTNSAGAGKVTADMLKPLKSMRVILLQDNDDAGADHVDTVARLLTGIAASVHVITPIIGGWNDIPHGDISDRLPADFVEAREYVESLIALAQPWEQDRPETTTHKTEWTAAELMAAEFAEPDYIIPDVLPEGILALLAGRPKIGKSWLALQWAAAVGNGGKIWGRPAKKGKVLYLALEDNPRRIQKRIRSQQWAAGGDVVFKFAWRTMADGGLADLEKEIATKEYTMVVIDTLARFAKFKQREVEETTDVIGPIQRLALEFNCTIVLIDHHRKSAGNAGDVVDDVMESTGKTAVADTIIGLYKIRGETVATLKTTGRDQDEAELALKWDGEFCCWQCLGEAAEVAKTEGQKVVMEALAEFDGTATTSQIAALTGKDVGYVSRVLAELMVRKVVEQPETRGAYKIINWSQKSQMSQNHQNSQNSQNQPVQEGIEF